MAKKTTPPLHRLLAILILSGALPALPIPAIAHAPITPPAASTASIPGVLLASNYDNTIDPAAYWVSEKLDGVRALWDGKTLGFRSGRPIHAPAWFTAALPAHALDGELWMGRQQFDRTSAAVRRSIPHDDEWRQISYQIFEWPGAPGSFSDRIAAQRASIQQANTPW